MNLLGINIKENINNKFILFISGGLFGLSFAPYFITLSIIFLALLPVSIYFAKDFKTCFGSGFAFGFGCFLVSISWVSNAIGAYAQDLLWFWPFVFFGLPAILACFFGAACALSFPLRQCVEFRLIFCYIFIFVEWLRSFLFTGFPWNLLSHSLAFSDYLLQSISIFGSFGLSLLVLYVATISYYFLIGRNNYFLKSIIVSFCIILALILMGIIRIQSLDIKFHDINIRLVQPSTIQSSKWNMEKFHTEFKKYINLSKDHAFDNDNPAIIIWPEAAIIFPVENSYITKKLKYMLRDIEQTNSPSVLVTGTIGENLEQDQYYASMKGINSSGEIILSYNKNHLVPFGEYIPFSNILAKIGFKTIVQGGGYNSGEDLENAEHILPKPFNLKIKPLICYESIFPAQLRGLDNKKIDVIFNISNDSWYGDSAGPYQHLHISRIRAIELGAPMLRAASNGISAVIGPAGRIIAQTKLDEIGILDSALPAAMEQKTIYSRFSELTVLALMFLLYIIEKFFILRSNSSRAQKKSSNY